MAKINFTAVTTPAIRYHIGQLVLIDGEDLAMFVATKFDRVFLISLHNGCRYVDDIEVENVNAITPNEVAHMVAGNRIEIFTGNATLSNDKALIMTFIVDREHILEQLRAGVLDIKFKKKDGTIRNMRATLNFDELSIVDRSAALDSLKGTDLEYSYSAIRVFDMEKKAWRAFRANSIISTQVVR